MAKLIREKVGRSFGYEWTSMAYQEENASSSTSIIFILAIVVAFLILAAQYESWTDPFAVIMGLPIALLGVVIGVMVMNLPISVYTQIGVYADCVDHVDGSVGKERDPDCRVCPRPS